jgi:hypothetical protein
MPQRPEVSFPLLAAHGEDAGAFDGKVAVGAPDLGNAEILEKNEARGVDVGELASAETFQLSKDGIVVIRVEGKQFETGEFRESQAEDPGGFLSQSMEKPAVGFRDDGQRGDPFARRVSEEADRRPMIAVAAVQEGDEDAGIEEDPARSRRQGRDRP